MIGTIFDFYLQQNINFIEILFTVLAFIYFHYERFRTRKIYLFQKRLSDSDFLKKFKPIHL